MKHIALLIDSSIEDGMASSVGQYIEDLAHDGYHVIKKSTPPSSPPDEVRQQLRDLQGQYAINLDAALLVGDIPWAYQYVSSSSGQREIISYQYYSDLDGQFRASSGYSSPGGNVYSYDMHTGDTDWEIAVGVLPMYKGDPHLTIQAINRYFNKNHDCRIGRVRLPRAFLQISEHFSASSLEEHEKIMGWMTTGTYAWTPFSNSPSAHIYFDSPVAGISVDEGYRALSEGIADFAVCGAHGNWRAHGRIDISWVESHPIRAFVFWSDGCAVGDLDHEDNFLTSVLYSPTSSVLVAKGTTNSSGGIGTNEDGFYGHNIATSLTSGYNIGQSILRHVNAPLIDPWAQGREFHFGPQIILGDPTYSLQTAYWRGDATFVAVATDYSAFLYPPRSRSSRSMIGRINIYCDPYRLYLNFVDPYDDSLRNTYDKKNQIGRAYLPFATYSRYLDLLRNERPVLVRFFPDDSPPSFTVYAPREAIGEGEALGL